MIILVKTLTILVAATSMMLVGLRHREWRDGLLLLSCVFFATGMSEFEWLFQPLFSIDEPELPAIIFFLFLGVILAWLNRGTTGAAFRTIRKNRRLPLLVWGLCLVSFLPPVCERVFHPEYGWGVLETYYTNPDGGIETKIIDFEPESKMAIPLEAIWPWFRRMKLRRKAKRYLKHIRETYGITTA